MGSGPAAGAKGGRSSIRRAITESLRRLRPDSIDLYQLHVPDPVTPVEETLAARVPSTSRRLPKLLQPSPTTDTSSPDCPRGL